MMKMNGNNLICNAGSADAVGFGMSMDRAMKRL